MNNPMEPGVWYDYNSENKTLQKTKQQKVASIDSELYADNPTPGHPDWNITKKGGKKKKIA